MKQLIKAALFEKNSKATLIIALALLGLAILGCSGGGGGSSAGKDKPVTSDYYGGWGGSDGTSLQIKSDGTGYYRSGGTTINGAAAVLDESGTTLKLTFFGVSTKEFKIDQAPKNGTMKLDGMVYKNGFNSGGDTTSSSSDDSDSSSAELPSQSDIDDMVQEIIVGVNDSVQSGDFETFRTKYGSKQFIEQVSNDKLKTEFADFINRKKEFNELLKSTADLTPTYSPKPNITEESGYKLLNIDGQYKTIPPTHFTLQYVHQGGDWKLLRVRVLVK
jgi:hypothetical protein